MERKRERGTKYIILNVISISLRNLYCLLISLKTMKFPGAKVKICPYIYIYIYTLVLMKQNNVSWNY